MSRAEDRETIADLRRRVEILERKDTGLWPLRTEMSRAFWKALREAHRAGTRDPELERIAADAGLAAVKAYIDALPSSKDIAGRVVVDRRAIDALFTPGGGS